MPIPSADQLRGMLRFLDLKPLFLLVAGNHMFGFQVPDPVVRVAGGHRRALEAALGEGTNRAVVRAELAVAGMDVRIRSEDRAGVAARIRRLDFDFLEALHSPLVIVGEDEVRRLREAAAGYVTIDIRDYYRDRARGALRLLESRKSHGVPEVLFLYRALLSGLHAVETGSLEVDLALLIEVYDLPFLADLVRRPDRPPFVGDPARMGFLLGESQELFHRLEAGGAASRLPATPVDPGALDAWEMDPN